ncbi:DUF523 and DUF1722 domain-containing protein [uncultured Methanolobus sp.]|uniref:YbgA family protein n=1 Tax=uncultured Methanolobus sp. TaxID=218300 RepID=UPI0029C704DC|nr:DUF523 and DUF1722 domain-containing protein [uncultured Methanolobus sp.]
MKIFPKPIVLVSRCLEFDKVRYNGQVIPSKIVRDLIPFVDFIKVCPEVGIGLGVPRDVLRIIRQNGEYHLVQPKTGQDLTERMNSFTNSFLDGIDAIDGFIFKGLSPSMGVDDVKVYAGASMAPVVEKGAGLFAKEVIARYEGYPIEENERLRNNHIRDHFLTKLYTFAAFRNIMSDNFQKELVKFHKNNFYLFMSYDRELSDKMSELLNKDIEDQQMFMEYSSLLKQIMKKPGNLDLRIDTSREHFSNLGDITPSERGFFENILERFAKNQTSWDAVIEIMRMMALRSFGDVSYKDSFLYPYPEELKAEVDDRREKDYWGDQ